MKNNGGLIRVLVCMVLGVILLGLGSFHIVDEFWSGMGTSMIFISILRLVRIFRFRKDAAYREYVEISAADERNRFIRNKAWAWTGYLFILITGCSVIVLKILGQELLCLAASSAVCLMLVLYWVTYWVLQKKY